MSWKKKTVGLSALLIGSFVLGRATAPRASSVPDHDWTMPAGSAPAASGLRVVSELEPTPPEARRSADDQPVTETRSSETRDVTLCEAFSILSHALLDHPVGNGDDASFCEKYRGATLEQFQVARALVRKQYESERQRIVDERLRNGLYEARSEGEEPFQVTTAKGSNPVAFGFASEWRGEALETRTTTIPVEEYPEFRDLQSEWLWLERQARGPGSIDCDR